MKKTVFALAVAAAMAASAELKVASVNMMELVAFHPRHDDDRKLLKSKEADYKKRLDEKREAIEKIEKEFRDAQQEAQNPMLTDNAKKAAFAKLEDIQKRGIAAQGEYRSAGQDFQADLQKLEADLMRAITSSIHEKIEAFAKEKGYDLILDAAATPFVAPELDATDDVLRLFGVDGEAKRAEAKKEIDKESAAKETGEKEP